MLNNKIILPLIASSLILTSCGLGNEISRDDFSLDINNISNVSGSDVYVKGTLSSKNADVESKIVFIYNFTYENEIYTANKVDAVSNDLVSYLKVLIFSDFEKTTNNETAKFYMRGQDGFAITFEVGSDDEQVASFYGKYEYQYDTNGRYTNVKEYETFINEGLTYTTQLEISFTWSI